MYLRKQMGGMHYAKWPRKRGKSTSPAQLDRTAAFKLAIEMIRAPAADDLNAAIEITTQVPSLARDLLMMAAYGQHIEATALDGTVWKGWPLLTDTAQSILDQVTKTPGAILVRTYDGWRGLIDALNGQVLTFVGGTQLVDWLDPSGGGGGGLWSETLPSTPPTRASSGLTNDLNLGGMAVNESLSALSLIAPSDGSTQQLRGIYVPAPATPWSLTACSGMFTTGGNYSNIAWGFYDGSAKMEAVLYGVTNGSAADLELVHFSDPSTYAASPVAINPPFLDTLLWWEIEDDGTTITYRMGPEQQSMVDFAQVTKAGSYLGAGGYSNIFVGTRAYGAPMVHSLFAFG